jgi:hypothetical protein
MLQSPEERKLTEFIMEDEQLSREDAKAIEQMRKMPAWKGLTKLRRIIPS